jgi:CSLREA domain-containing protein
MNRGSRKTALGLLTAVVLVGSAAPALAATIAPTTTADQAGTGAECSLREAIQAASDDAAFGGCPAGSGADTIPLASGTYGITIPPDGTPNDNLDGDIDMAESVVTLAHEGIAPTTISGNKLDRIFHLGFDGKLTASGVTIRDGNSTDRGGGIFVDGGGELKLSNAALADNFTSGFGGAIANNSNVTLTNVTISGNHATGVSGAVDSFGVGITATFNNVTVTKNISDTDVGGITEFSNAVVTLRNTIVAGNIDTSPVGGIVPDCNGPIASLGNNLIGNLGTGDECEYISAPGDKVGHEPGGLDPFMGPLADNGGPTFTHELLIGSPAIDAGNAAATAFDQRGVPRGIPDMGAYERVTCGKVAVNRVGTTGADLLVGTAGADSLLGLDGPDTLKGFAGADRLCGGGGEDRLKGGRGRDKLMGDAGPDRLFGGRGPDKLVGGLDQNRCRGGRGRDHLFSC